MVVLAAGVEAAPQVIAFAGAIITESVEVLSMTAFIAFLEAIAVLAAKIAARIRMAGYILGTAAWAVLVDCAPLLAIVANSIA